MRIIAGTARGRTLNAPKGLDTRPTQDYVRESLFNIIQRDVPGAVVLDLFAGSGALGLEAVSRGASEAVLADKAPQAIACIERNIETLKMPGSIAVYAGDWQTVLTRLHKMGKRFSLVFLDPPYRMTDTGAQCTKMADLHLLENGALIVIEHHRDVEPMPDTRFRRRDERRYGDTVIHFYTYFEGMDEDA